MASAKFSACLAFASLTVALSFSPSFVLHSSLRASAPALRSVNRPLLCPARPLASGGLAKLSMSGKSPILSSIDKVVKENKIIVFMKGTKDFPQCGFSNTVVQILKATGAQFETVNVLENPMLRQGIKEYTNWPTIPQVFIGGEFIGGCDIVTEMYQNGELVELVEKTLAE